MAGKKTEFLYLNEEEMIKAGVLDSKHCVDVLDEMFKLVGKGDYVCGGPNHNEHGIKISFPDHPEFPGMPANGPDRRFMAMVGYLGGRFHVSECKWYGSNVINPSRGLPRSVLMVMLNDPDTCEPLALMSGNLISSTRTGCVPGVAVRYLESAKAEVCTCIGAGPISRACLSGILAESKHIKRVAVFDINDANADKFVEWASKTFKIDVVKCATTEEAVKMGDVISVATSRLKPVALKNEWLKPGSLLILTGACHLEDDYILSSKIVFDNPLMFKAYMADAHRSEEGVEAAYAYMMGGDILRLIEAGKLPAIEKQTGLGNIAIGQAPGRESDDERIIMQTSGMPTEDAAWGCEIYRKAKEMGLGTKLLLWNEPYL